MVYPVKYDPLGEIWQGELEKLLLTGELINEKLLSNTNIPIFRHSIIPSARQELKPQWLPLI